MKAGVMVNVIQMPSERVMLASCHQAKVRLGAGIQKNESATSDEVARLGNAMSTRGTAGEHHQEESCRNYGLSCREHGH